VRLTMGTYKTVAAQVVCALLLSGMAVASGANPITSGEKAKVKGTIVSRNGDAVKIRDSKDGQPVIVNVSDNTKIERKKGKVQFYRHSDMDVTAMVPGLTIEAEGVGGANGSLDASKISFTPDEFAIEVAEEKQIQANKSSAGAAQTTANQGVAAAGAAQSTANQGVAAAGSAQSTADAAGGVAVMDAAAIEMVNKRVSDLDDYKTVAEAGIYYETGKYALDAAAKADLDKLADIALGLPGYMIEVAGYASKTGSKADNQKLSEERANAVAHYLRVSKNIPMRRILAPAGYGSTHPAATNSDSQGRELNRRVDVKVLVNKGLDSGM
jgi:outer membrane protein OmpA-like peptidoglycan-associated protein